MKVKTNLTLLDETKINIFFFNNKPLFKKVAYNSNDYKIWQHILWCIT